MAIALREGSGEASTASLASGYREGIDTYAALHRKRYGISCSKLSLHLISHEEDWIGRTHKRLLNARTSEYEGFCTFMAAFKILVYLSLGISRGSSRLTVLRAEKVQTGATNRISPQFDQMS